MTIELIANGGYNRETGEIQDIMVITNPAEYTVISKEKEANKKAYIRGKENKEMFEELAGSFTFTLSSTIKELNQDQRFTPAEKTRIMFLGTYVTYQEQGSYLRHDNGNFILKNKLQDLFEIKNKKEFYTFYNKLVETGILSEDIEGRSKIYLKWNSKYHFKGKPSSSAQKEKNLVKTFDKQVRELYKEKNEKGKAVHTPNNLYTLFMVMPYIHPEANILCKFPENDLNTCEPLTINELAEMFGFSRSNDLKKKLFKVMLKGFPVFTIQQNAFVSHILVNPFVVYRSGKAPNPALLIHFRDSAIRLMTNKGITATPEELLHIK
ncbi:hypothetical protein LG311_17870 [Sutcliffiella horikoshii]|uniref:hypothetical protein n=1 Tax=Sutcliffiella horikoshii TaxID=79883 RepID=UPI00385084BB